MTHRHPKNRSTHFLKALLASDQLRQFIHTVTHSTVKNATSQHGALINKTRYIALMKVLIVCVNGNLFSY